MKKPTITTIFWLCVLLLVLGAALLKYLLIAPNPQQQIVFGDKTYFDSSQTALGDAFIVIEGELSGKGVGYKNNETTIACYHNEMQCLVSAVQQIGPNQVSSLDPPARYSILKWNAYEVVATSGDSSFDCSRVTINIERKSESVEWVQEPINKAHILCKNADTNTYKWSIETPPYWDVEKAGH